MSNLARFASFKPTAVLKISLLTLLLSIWAGVESYLAAQAPSDSLLGFSAQTVAKLRELRQHRDNLGENLREQRSQAQKLLAQEKGLLSLQGQLQQKIGEAQKDLKLPQLPAEYQAKKCRLQEMQTQQQKTAQNLQQTQQQIQQLSLSMSTLQNQIAQTQRQIAQSQGSGPTQTQQQALQDQQLAQQQAQQEAQRLAQEQARQNANNLLTSRMTQAANPLNGLSNETAQATATITSGGGSSGGGTTYPPITRTAPDINGSVFFGMAGGLSNFAPVDRGTLDPAGTITVSFNYSFTAIAPAGTVFTVLVQNATTGAIRNRGTFTTTANTTNGSVTVRLTTGNQGDFITAGVNPAVISVSITGGPSAAGFTFSSIVITFNS